MHWIVGFVVGVFIGFAVGMALYLTKPDKYQQAAKKLDEELKQISEELHGKD